MTFAANLLWMCHLPRDADRSPVEMYRDQVDTWVRDCLGDGHIAWCKLLRTLPGVYPSTVLESLERLGIADRVTFGCDSSFDAIAGGRATSHNQLVLHELPTAHPLDFCWWFDVSTIQLIVSRLKRLSAEAAHVSLLGAPTVFERASREISRRTLSLVDADERTLRCVAVGHDRASTFLADLTCDSVTLPTAEVIVADPPWYVPMIRSFLWFARHLCELGSLVLISVPPKGTRPGVEDEWRDVKEWSVGLGLELRTYEPGILSYVSPLFEMNALRASGVPLPTGSWRTGDLATFQCVDRCHHTRPPAMPRVEWRERAIDDVRVRFRGNGSPFAWSDPTLSRIADTDIFPTVSQRDSRRGLADVWTSGNRAFACKGPEIALEILDAIATTSDAVQRVERVVGHELAFDERSSVKRTEAKLRTIMELEHAELAAWKEHHARVDLITR
jgi:putative N6-adenine methyltransferase